MVMAGDETYFFSVLFYGIQIEKNEFNLVLFFRGHITYLRTHVSLYLYVICMYILFLLQHFFFLEKDLISF